MKTLIKTKLLEDKYIEAREYELFKDVVKLIHCTALDYKLCNHFEDKFMILNLNQQKKGKVVNTLQSKFPPYAYYRMYKFLFKPTKIEKNLDEKPTSMNTILAGLSEEQIDELRAKLGIDKKIKRV